MGKRYAAFWKKSVEYGFQAPLLVIIIAYFFFIWMPSNREVTSLIWSFVLALLPFILPILLGQLVIQAWLEYKRQRDYWSTEYTVLEVRLPEEITQTPLAAELFLRVLYQTGEVDTDVHGLRGKTKPWFSLEIASTEGRVRFYVWTRTRYKEIVKAQLYAHYPTVQVVEVPDYTLAVPYDPAVVDIWGITQQFQKPDPYPLMTYQAWKLHEKEKEEFKNDPLLSLIEFMGSLGPGEHMWSQIILRAHTVCPWSHETTHHEMNIVEWADYETRQIAKKWNAEDKEKGNLEFLKMDDADKERIKMMQAKLSKPMFDVGIRTIYVPRHESRDSGRNAGVPTAFRSFEHGSEGRGMNGFKPIFYIGHFNFAWHDFMGIRRARLKRRMYEAYVTRQFFWEPHRDYYIALNSEEIASIWHFPGKVAHTPTLERLPSRRAEAPANLPI